MPARRATSTSTAEPFGVRWFVGIPQSGKTTLALAEAARLHRATRLPVLVLDGASARQLSGLPRACSVEHAIECVWGMRQSCAYKPRDLREVDRLCAAVDAGKDVVLFVDEAHNWLSARSGSSAALIGIMRATQHARCHVLLTTQHLTGDVPQAALSCAPLLFVFRCTSSAVLKTLRDNYELAPELVARLPQYEFVRHRIGF